jgi:hypothetical protein
MRPSYEDEDWSPAALLAAAAAAVDSALASSPRMMRAASRSPEPDFAADAVAMMYEDYA